MATQTLNEYTTTEETPKLQFEDTNSQTQENIEPPFPHLEPLISLHALSSISTPQNLQLTNIKH
jgi:hypothetical protein